MITVGSPSVCIANGNVVAFVGGGTCTVTANQAGNTGYDTAAPVSQTVKVGYHFEGFLDPIKNGDALNTAKAAQAIPKWRLRCERGSERVARVAAHARRRSELLARHDDGSADRAGRGQPGTADTSAAGTTGSPTGNRRRRTRRAARPAARTRQRHDADHYGRSFAFILVGDEPVLNLSVVWHSDEGMATSLPKAVGPADGRKRSFVAGAPLDDAPEPTGSLLVRRQRLHRLRIHRHLHLVAERRRDQRDAHAREGIHEVV